MLDCNSLPAWAYNDKYFPITLPLAKKSSHSVIQRDNTFWMSDLLIYELTQENHALGYFIYKNGPWDYDESFVLNKMSLFKWTWAPDHTLKKKKKKVTQQLHDCQWVFFFLKWIMSLKIRLNVLRFFPKFFNRPLC